MNESNDEYIFVLIKNTYDVVMEIDELTEDMKRETNFRGIKFSPKYKEYQEKQYIIETNAEKISNFIQTSYTGKEVCPLEHYNGYSVLMFALDLFENRAASEWALLDLVHEMIDSGKSNPGYVDPESGNTALMIACRDMIPNDIILKLIQTGESKPGQASYINKMTALLWACINKMNTVAIELINTGESNPTAVDTEDTNALMNACAREMADVAQAIIALGVVDLSHVNIYGSTALMLACNGNLPEVALTILQAGNANIGAVDKNGRTALLLSCIRGLDEVALALIATGESRPDTIDKKGDTALIYACVLSSNLGMERVGIALIQTGKSLPGQINIYKSTALTLSCSANNTPLSLALIRTGESKPDVITSTNKTALLIACEKKMEEVALALIDTGNARPGHIDHDANALLFACKNELPNVALALLQTGQAKPEFVTRDQFTALYVACNYKLDKVALELIAHHDCKPGLPGGPIELTPLMVACIQGLENVANALLDTGKSNPNSVSRNKSSALVLACEYNLQSVALRLIEMGSYAQQINDKNNTALIFACDHKMVEVALALIQTGNSLPGHVSGQGYTALMISCIRNLSTIALALIQTGESKPDIVNPRGNTALISACNNSMSEVAMALIQTGQSLPGYVGKNGNTALMMACFNNMTAVANALLDTNDAKPSQENSSGMTALYYANSNHMTDVVKRLRTQLLTLNMISIDEEGFDAVNQEDRIIKEYLQENPNNLCFMLEGKYYLSNRTVLVKQSQDTANIKYECINSGSSYADLYYITDANIIRTVEYLSLTAILGMQIVATMKDINMVTNTKNKHQLYSLVKSERVLASIISKAIHEGAGMMSGDHCQEGKTTHVYNIIMAYPDCGCKESATPSSIAKSPAVREITIQYKTGSYKIPITDEITIGDVKQQLLEQLLAQQLIPNVNQSVRFIYKGKLYTADDQLLSALENPPDGITLQAMVATKPVGGSGRRTRRLRR